MVKQKYGEFSDNQMVWTKQYMRKRIYFLLLYVDPKTSASYPNVDVDSAINGLLLRLSGLNSVLFYPKALVNVISLLEAARIEYNNPEFDFKVYRKLILDAGTEVLDIEGVE